MMDIFLSIMAVICSLAGVAGCVIPIIPGPLLSFASVLCAYLCSYTAIPTATVFVWLGVTVAVSVMDYVLPSYMARRFGGTKAGSNGALAGMVIGMIFFNIAGVVFGPFVGAVVGELLHDSRDKKHALKVGFGSFLSFVVGTGVKLAAAIWMLTVAWGDTFAAVKTWAESL